jgi:integrase
VNEFLLAYYRQVEQNYRHPDGSPSRTLDNIKDALRPVRELYGHTEAQAFGPKALKAVQVRMVESGLCRNTINRRVGRIKSMFRWAESEELIPPSTYHALQTVRGLAKGRTAARDTEPIRPVAPEVVEATLPFLQPTVADMAKLQQFTGMRAGELVILRAIDLEMGGKVWLYRPGSDNGTAGTHKTAHHGHQRVIAIGPRGQEIVKKYLKPDLYAYLFSPREVVAAQNAARRRKRKTKIQPSQRDRSKRNPRHPPGERYRVGSYAQAIMRAVRAANRAHRCEACKAPEVEELCPECRTNQLPHWHPHQVRHSKATEIRRVASLGAARAVLGHRSPTVTEVYAELDMGKAAEVMERLG